MDDDEDFGVFAEILDAVFYDDGKFSWFNLFCLVLIVVLVVLYYWDLK